MLPATILLKVRMCCKYSFDMPQFDNSIELGPNIHWTSSYGTGIVFIGNMLSWLSFHNFV